MNLFLSDKAYNTLKWIAQYLLPASAALYFGLSQFWSLPVPEQIVGTIVAVDAFLGTLLGVSTLKYQKTTLFESVKNSLFPAVNEAHSSSPTYLFALPQRVYDILKWITIVLLPASGALYFAISQLWGLPNAEAVVGTIASLAAFMGAFLGYNSSQYKKTILVEPDVS